LKHFLKATFAKVKAALSLKKLCKSKELKHESDPKIVTFSLKYFSKKWDCFLIKRQQK